MCSYEELGQRTTETESGGVSMRFAVQNLPDCWVLFFWVELLNLQFIGRIIADLCLFRQAAMTLQYLLEEKLEIKYAFSK